ncbi:hypothetical protein N9231_02540 [Saprospiraceae bacterium]|nr:hypothetical protein [Saprospiraceae bacterium]
MMHANILPTNQDDQLISLMKSLTKAEKRNFKLYVNRLQSKSDVKFVQLFDVVDKLDSWNDVVILKKLPSIKKAQLANLKRHLYKQILISLRLIHIHKNVDIQIREQIDFAKILYGKGLYIQSLKLLERIRVIAQDNHQDLLLLDILEFQKVIEERHITRSRQTANKVESLIQASEEQSKIISNSSKLTNLKIEIHGFYIQYGHVKNDKDVKVVRELFSKRLKDIELEGLTFYEKVYLHQCYVWYYYTLLNFKKCLADAIKWTDIFEQNPSMKREEPDLYMRGVHYELTCLYNLKKVTKFNEVLSHLENFNDFMGEEMKTVSKILYFLYFSTAKLNKHRLEGSFDEGIEHVPEIIDKINEYETHLDPHRILVLYYKIAFQFFGKGDYNTMLDYINKIINLEFGQLREDLQGYARLLQLIGHYELENYELLEYLAPSTYRFLEKMKELNVMQTETLKFLKKLIKTRNVGHRELFISFRDKLTKLENDPHSIRALVYLDLIPWVESKIQKRSIQSIIQESKDSLDQSDR